MTTINVNVPNVASSSASGAGDSNSTDQIATLKKQLVTLQKKLQDVQKSQSKDAAKQSDLIQLQIITIQSRIDELESRQAKSAGNSSNTATQPVNKPESATASAKSTAGALGNNVNEII